MEEKKEVCDKTCTCGCNEGKECTCSCGCGEGKECTCGSDCKCGCNK